MSPLHGMGQTTIEPELQGRTPRSVRYTGGTQGARLFVWLLLIGVLGLIAHLGTGDLDQLKALKARGEAATGHITGRHVNHGKSDTYYLEYMFMTDRGAVSDDEEVSSSDYEGTADGAPLTVTYLPADPDTHRVGVVDDHYLQNSTKDWLLGGAAAFLAFGLIVFFTERNFRNHRDLLANGVPVTGTITNKHITAGSKSNYYYVEYEFEAPGGKVTGKLSVAKSLFDQTYPETSVTILYQPYRPNNNRPYYLLTDVRLA